MYAYIKGVIAERNDQQIVVENNGIGYLINCPLGISAEIGGIGDNVTVYLYQSVKEDDISLYGFNSRDQKEMFLKLITVSGIGPKVAHTICASLSAEQIAAAVMSGNVTLLSSVKGLGKKTAEKIIDALRSQNTGYYEFKGKDGLIVYKNNNTYKQEWIDKTFHADTYCFDSKPELECFLQYIASEKVQEVYFTGMFTADQGDLGIQYYDPESGRIRKYYPDFFAKMSDGTYQLIEVKGDHMIDDTVVKAKKDAAEEMATASKMQYVLYAGSRLMKEKVLEAIEATQGTFTDTE